MHFRIHSKTQINFIYAGIGCIGNLKHKDIVT